MGQVGQLVDHYVLYERRLQHHGAPVEAHYIVKSILRESIDVSRVVMRDRMSYCSIILDDNQFKGICRLLFNPNPPREGVWLAS